MEEENPITPKCKVWQITQEHRYYPLVMIYYITMVLIHLQVLISKRKIPKQSASITISAWFKLPAIRFLLRGLPAAN